MKDREYLLHVQKAISEIAEHTSGLSREDFETDTKTQRAVERNIQIIGEAVHRLSAELKAAHPEVEWDGIYATRNVVVHHYFGVDRSIVWDILLEDLPRLKGVVDGILARE